MNALKSLRENLGLTQEQVGNAIGVSKQNYGKWELGRNLPSTKNMLKLAEFFKVDVSEIFQESMDFVGGTEYVNSVPIYGYVGAGGEIFAFDDSSPVEYTTLPPDCPEGMFGAQVRGNSMLPFFKPGNRVYWKPNETIVPDSYIGDHCVVQTEEGRLLLKIIKRGSRRGLWNLESYNFETMSDIKLDWVAPVRWLDMSRRSQI